MLQAACVSPDAPAGTPILAPVLLPPRLGFLVFWLLPAHLFGTKKCDEALIF
jgi:hypothetical protein